MSEKNRLGIYVHIPFCLKKCLYCDFCSFPEGKDKTERYAKELCRRIETAPEHSDRIADTLYFGGGTPTLLPVEIFGQIFETVNKCFDLLDTAEITAECNPATADKKYLRALRDIGINRLSIGLQSVHEKELSALGRSHSFEDFLRTYEYAREAGFSNISADLMYGIPHQTRNSFEESLSRLSELSPEHISAYGLKVEKGTPFYKMRDRLPLPDEETECEMYLLMSELLPRYGYYKYEISNFAKKGRESKHNLKYWTGGEYLGFGVAAHSYFGGERFGNSRDMDAFMRGECIECERYTVSDRERINEYIMLSMRLARGIDLSVLEKMTGKGFYELFPSAKALKLNGYITEQNGRAAFTDKGFLVSNTILSDMLEFD